MSRLLLCFAWPLFVTHHTQVAAVSVLDYGADPSGKNDSTQAFRKALQSTGGVLVDVPAGRYMITSALNVSGQTLQGSGHAAWGTDEPTVAMPTIDFHPFGSGSHSPFVLLGGGGSVHGLNVEYNWGNKSPQAVPPCIHIVGQSGPRVTDMRIKGAWNAVSSLGTQNAGRYYLANLFIVDSYHYGVAMSEARDFSVMDTIEVWITKTVTKGKGAVGIGILIHGVDGLRASNLAVFGTEIGILVTSQPKGRPQHKAWVAFSSVTVDKTHTGMLIEGMGNDVTLSSAQFQSDSQSLIVRGDSSTCRVSATRFKSNGAPAVEIHGSNTVSITGSGFHRVFPKGHKVPALSISNNPAQSVLITGNDIEVSGDTAILCHDVEASHKESCANGSVMLHANLIKVNQTRQPPKTHADDASEPAALLV